MFAKVKCVSDIPGFTKGDLYPVLSFGESVCMVMNDDEKVVGVSHDAINGEGWELQPLEGAEKKPGKKSAKD
jgi:hypothetical protein